MFLFRNENYQNSLNSFMNILKFLGSLLSVKLYYSKFFPDDQIVLNSWFDFVNYVVSNQFVVKFAMFGVFYFIFYDLAVVIIRLLYSKYFSPFMFEGEISKYKSTRSGRRQLDELTRQVRERYAGADDLMEAKKFMFSIREFEIYIVRNCSLYCIIVAQLETPWIIQFAIIGLWVIFLLVLKPILKISEEVYKEMLTEFKNGQK